jgi:hypothetical protein
MLHSVGFACILMLKVYRRMFRLYKWSQNSFMRLMCSVASDNIALVSLINKSVGFIRVNEGQFFITVG